MSVEQLLHSLPLPLVVILLVSVSVLLAVGGLLWVRRAVPLPVLEENNEFQDFIVGTIGVFYAILLAFVVFAVWDQFRETDRIVEAEANKLGDLLRNVEGMPELFRKQVQGQVRDYAELVVEDEWPALAQDQESARARDAFDRLWLVYQDFEPRTEREKAIYAEGLARLSELREQRRLRLSHGQEGVPGILWFVLIAGAVITICSTYFLGMRNFRAQVMLTAMAAGVMTLILVVILAFDRPFLGGNRLAPDVFQTQIEEADRFLQK